MRLTNLNRLQKRSPLSLQTTQIYMDSCKYATNKIDLFRSMLNKEFKNLPGNRDLCVVAVGSFGRHEASQESDLDVYVIHGSKGAVSTNQVSPILKKCAEKAGIKDLGDFNPISLSEMRNNIGGNDDTNQSITNRILFLLESVCLYNETFYKKAFDRILNKYLSDAFNGKTKLPRFLLNDIIRYYRTICVDYEFKTSTKGGKPWAIRNIKLRFSRKALYVGGILVLLNSLNKRNRINYIQNNINRPFVEKVSLILIEQKLEDKYKEIIELYANFISEIGDPAIRSHLKRLKKSERRADRRFKEMAKNARTFNDLLWKLMQEDRWGKTNILDRLVL